jgi:hypothetical protein
MASERISLIISISYPSISFGVILQHLTFSALRSSCTIGECPSISAISRGVRPCGCSLALRSMFGASRRSLITLWYPLKAACHSGVELCQGAGHEASRDPKFTSTLPVSRSCRTMGSIPLFAALHKAWFSPASSLNLESSSIPTNTEFPSIDAVTIRSEAQCCVAVFAR